MELKLGDVQTTALIPLAVKANETLRKNARIKDRKAVEIIRALKIDTEQYDKFMSHEGVVARTIMLDRQLKGIIKRNPDTVVVNCEPALTIAFPEWTTEKYCGSTLICLMR